jgi:succinylglutamate desuccinylase
VRGEVVILVGNRAALAAARRFVGRDLNRAWFDRRGQDVASPSQLPSEPEEPAHPEDREQRELLIEIEAAVARARGTILVLDLHTFSGRGCAFTTASDSLPERDFATAIPVPTILGLDEMVTGTLLSYLHQRGYVTAGFESGRHDEPAAIDRAEAGLWIAIVAAGCLRSNHAPEARAGRRRLEVELSGLRRVFEMSHRHAVAPGDGFRMRPGFENLQPVAAGTILAEDHRGLIAAPRSGRVLMPLYQEQGEDGFFLVREVPRWRRLVARALRRRSLRRRS